MVRYTILFVALLIGSWLAFDGARAFLSGSYTTPGSGAYAGQLGPWAKLVSMLGLNPTGFALKLAHVALGICWLVFGLLFFLGAASAWWPLLLTAVLSLWYLPFGTVAGCLVAGLLLLPAIRPVA